MKTVAIVIACLVLLWVAATIDTGTTYTQYETSDVQEETKQVERETEPETKPKNEHKHVKIFAFSSHKSTAYSSVRQWCKKGCCPNLGYKNFRGTPSDLSYLDVIEEHFGVDEMVGGEYYTVTAEISLKFYYPSSSPRVHINCKVENEDIIVGFNVEFREGFREQVALLEQGDEVTFRGRYYDEGCGFTDCELITE